MRPQELIRILKADGWFEVKRTGSHIHFHHRVKTNVLIVPYHASQDLGKGLTHGILKEAGLQ